MAWFNVRVVNDSYDPIQGTRVVLESANPKQGMLCEKYTNEEGYANFDEPSVGEVKVSIKGTTYGKYHYLGGRNITITL